MAPFCFIHYLKLQNFLREGEGRHHLPINHLPRDRERAARVCARVFSASLLFPDLVKLYEDVYLHTYPFIEEKKSRTLRALGIL